MSDEGDTKGTASGEDLERLKLELTLLEGRRASTDGFMWQGPVIALAVQAFLLRILADDSLHRVAATAIAVAGALATSAALLMLFILGDREVHYSKRITKKAKALEIEDPKRVREREADHILELRGRIVWGIVLGSFVIVDAVVLAAAQKEILLVIPVFFSVSAAWGITAAWCWLLDQGEKDTE